MAMSFLMLTMQLVMNIILKRQKRQLLLAKRLTIGGKTFTSTRELTIHHILKEDL